MMDKERPSMKRNTIQPPPGYAVLRVKDKAGKAAFKCCLWRPAPLNEKQPSGYIPLEYLPAEPFTELSDAFEYLKEYDYHAEAMAPRTRRKT